MNMDMCDVVQQLAARAPVAIWGANHFLAKSKPVVQRAKLCKLQGISTGRTGCPRMADTASDTMASISQGSRSVVQPGSPAPSAALSPAAGTATSCAPSIAARGRNSASCTWQTAAPTTLPAANSCSSVRVRSLAAEGRAAACA